MYFKVLAVGEEVPVNTSDVAYLLSDNWDDWFEFSTLYHLIIVDINAVKHEVGSLKIGQLGMNKSQRKPSLPEQFSLLTDQFFSVGQDDSFYENIKLFGDVFRSHILTALNDIAYDEGIYNKVIDERVTRVSLLRLTTPTSITGQYRRMAHGGVRLSKYSFDYVAAASKNNELPAIELSFNVVPESNPPTNIHILIGRNGVGKTHLLNNMISTLIDNNASPSKVGKFIPHGVINQETFSNVVSVTFSAFDESEPPPEIKDKTLGVRYSYVGLKRTKKPNEKSLPPKSPTLLKNEFVKSIQACKAGSKVNRWINAIETLETDPVFKESDIKSIINIDNEVEFKEHAANIFKKLSSGHKIVLLTITRLVETVEERSLILLDEPEAHLHPPLLSAFIRSLSDLLIQRNAIAIIATHSPVVLQEVPMSCTWKLWRIGSNAKVERLETESFGENVGILTREVFGLELTSSGFHKLLYDAFNDCSTFAEAIDSFDGQVGAEAKAILMALYSNKENVLDAGE